MSRYFQQRARYLLEENFGSKGDNAIGGNIHTQIEHIHPHVFVSYKIISSINLGL